jgi:hypothetical protein
LQPGFGPCWTESFESVTGPKVDFWLAQTVGVLVACIGGGLLLAAEQDRLTPEFKTLAAGSAAGLALIDVVYVLRGRISPFYFADAAIESALVAGWIAAR